MITNIFKMPSHWWPSFFMLILNKCSEFPQKCIQIIILKSPKTLVTIWLLVFSSKWLHNFQHPVFFFLAFLGRWEKKLDHCPHLLFLKSQLFQKYEFSHGGPSASPVIGNSTPDETMIKHWEYTCNLGYFVLPCLLQPEENTSLKQLQVITGKHLHFSSCNVRFFF